MSTAGRSGTGRTTSVEVTVTRASFGRLSRDGTSTIAEWDGPQTEPPEKLEAPGHAPDRHSTKEEAPQAPAGASPPTRNNPSPLASEDNSSLAYCRRCKRLLPATDVDPERRECAECLRTNPPKLKGLSYDRVHGGWRGHVTHQGRQFWVASTDRERCLEKLAALRARLGVVVLEPGTKRCRGCDRVLPIAAFQIARDGGAGVRGRCRECFRPAAPNKSASPIARGRPRNPAGTIVWDRTRGRWRGRLTTDAGPKIVFGRTIEEARRKLDDLISGRKPSSALRDRRPLEDLMVGPESAYQAWANADTPYADFRAWFTHADKPTKAGWAEHLRLERLFADSSKRLLLEPATAGAAEASHRLWRASVPLADFVAWFDDFCRAEGFAPMQQHWKAHLRDQGGDDEASVVALTAPLHVALAPKRYTNGQCATCANAVDIPQKRADGRGRDDRLVRCQVGCWSGAISVTSLVNGRVPVLPRSPRPCPHFVQAADLRPELVSKREADRASQKRRTEREKAEAA